MGQFWSLSKQYGMQQALSMSLVGDKTKVCHGSRSTLRETNVDEIMIDGQIPDHQARLHSFGLVMDVREELLGQYVLTREALSELATLSYVDLISKVHQALRRQQKCQIRHR